MQQKLGDKSHHISNHPQASEVEPVFDILSSFVEAVRMTDAPDTGSIIADDVKDMEEEEKRQAKRTRKRKDPSPAASPKAPAAAASDVDQPAHYSSSSSSSSSSS